VSMHLETLFTYVYIVQLRVCANVYEYVHIVRMCVRVSTLRSHEYV